MEGEAMEGERSAATDRCPMETALELIGTRSAMTLLREAFLGAKRFDDLVARAGLSSMTASVRLKEFVAAGLMYKRPYQAAYGTRCEYVLTDLGNQCYPVVEALMRFGVAVENASHAAKSA
jgi:DNA-binding HxlR family transcriptional regulator